MGKHSSHTKNLCKRVVLGTSRKGFLCIAAGELKTTACWIRDFVAAHPEYNKDSVVSERIAYDLLKKISQVRK